MALKTTGAVKPYHLRPHKAIERNLFVKTLKMLDRVPEIDLKDYRYVGFGAAFLEDFKLMHSEFGIAKMDSIEIDSKAFSRQVFNNPYSFIKLFNESSTDYINGGSLKEDCRQIIWLDYATVELAQQLKDVEQLAEKLEDYDILKLTFNSQIFDVKNYPTKFNKFNTEVTLKSYTPPNLTLKELSNDYSGVIRSMAFKAIKRGIASSGKSLEYTNLTAFDYSDGQRMTTMTGIISKPEASKLIIKHGGFDKWRFSAFGNQTSLKITHHDIEVPVMTISERITIDRKLKKYSPKRLAQSLKFQYGDDNDAIDYHEALVSGYLQYYSYLPFYSRVTF